MGRRGRRRRRGRRGGGRRRGRGRGGGGRRGRGGINISCFFPLLWIPELRDYFPPVDTKSSPARSAESCTDFLHKVITKTKTFFQSTKQLQVPPPAKDLFWEQHAVLQYSCGIVEKLNLNHISTKLSYYNKKSWPSNGGL